MRTESGFEFHDRVSEPIPESTMVPLPEPDWDDPDRVDDLDSFLTGSMLPVALDMVTTITRPAAGGAHPGLLKALIADDMADVFSWAGELMFCISLADERRGVSDEDAWRRMTAVRLGYEDWEHLLDCHPDLPLVFAAADRVTASGCAETIRLDGMPVDVLLAMKDDHVEARPVL